VIAKEATPAGAGSEHNAESTVQIVFIRNGFRRRLSNGAAALPAGLNAAIMTVFVLPPSESDSSCAAKP
jgi:hypothetical protein